MRSGEDELWKDAHFSPVPYELQCLFQCASADFTCSSREWWESWGGMGQEGSCEEEVLCSVGGMSALHSWEGGQGSLGKAGAVCGPRQRQDPPLEQRCRRVTDAVFSKCRAICGDTLWVWIWDKCSCFSAFCFAFKREAPLFSATKAS